MRRLGEWQEGVVEVGEETVEVEEVSWPCIMSIFLCMCERNKIHLLTLKELEMVSIGLRSLFMVENRVLGFLLPDCLTEE